MAPSGIGQKIVARMNAQPAKGKPAPLPIAQGSRL